MSFSLRPRKMKRIEISVLSRDVDAVLEFLGRRALMQFSSEGNSLQGGAKKETVSLMREEFSRSIRDNLDKLSSAAAWLELELPSEPSESSSYPGEAEELECAAIIKTISTLSSRENELCDEKRKVEETLSEAKAFANLNAPFSDLDQLSYLTLRVGRVDSKRLDELTGNLSGRDLVIPLGEEGGRILAATSRKGRFALDSELKKIGFIPISVPKGYNGIPSELISGLQNKLKTYLEELEDIYCQKKILREKYKESLQDLTASYIMAGIIEELKSRLVATQNVYLLSGWAPAEKIRSLVDELERLTQGRIALRSYSPEEIDKVREGREKVPVSLSHGIFIKGFERLVFSYGVPLYGSIDPTPFVAFFFTLIFGIMFGDMGQGFVLFLLGILTAKRGPAFFSRFRHFSIPLLAVGISSMLMGFLTGSVFTNEEILKGPTRALTSFLTGRPVDRILTIMPLSEYGGSVAKLFYFFGFTISVGVLLNSLGLIINITNQFILKNYQKVFISKTGIAGILLFWYALFIAIRFVVAMLGPADFAFYWFDIAGLLVPLLAITFGPAFWRFFSGERPVLSEGIVVFVVECFVEVLETVSTYFSNTVSFLRVGAFALSHAVLSFIVFSFCEKVSTTPAGTLAGFLIFVFGNLIIILLEGLIVAIQVVRLQYYEFFSKFFTETGEEFTPFRFSKD